MSTAMIKWPCYGDGEDNYRKRIFGLLSYSKIDNYCHIDDNP